MHASFISLSLSFIHLFFSYIHFKPGLVEKKLQLKDNKKKTVKISYF